MTPLFDYFLLGKSYILVGKIVCIPLVALSRLLLYFIPMYKRENR